MAHGLVIEKYYEQKDKWPKMGKHILAQSTEDAILVYQAFKPSIVAYAVEHGHFGGPDYSPKRMTWIKTNFLWMMFRSGWGTKPSQEATVGVWIKRSVFEEILSKAVHAQFEESVYGSRAEYNKIKAQQKSRNNNNNNNKLYYDQNKEDEDVDEDEDEEGKGQSLDYVVRLQWDPDHHPSGGKHASRRAIQLGLKGWKGFFTGEGIVKIVDLTEFVKQQRENVDNLSELQTPKETVYQVQNKDLIRTLELEEWQEEKEKLNHDGSADLLVTEGSLG